MYVRNHALSFRDLATEAKMHKEPCARFLTYVHLFSIKTTLPLFTQRKNYLLL